MVYGGRMMNRCGLCGLQKELIDNLCERCREIERLMGECLDSPVGLDDMSIPYNVIPIPFFGTPCNLDRSWMNNFPIEVHKINTARTVIQTVRDISDLPTFTSSSISYQPATTSICITPHEYCFIISYELEMDLGAITIDKILNNIIKLIILNALGEYHPLLGIVDYDGSINTKYITKINYEMLMALFYLNIDSQLQSLLLGKRIILIERVPWERAIAVYENLGKTAYYSRYGVGIMEVCGVVSRGY